MSTNNDWSRFTVRINVKADPLSLYKAWSTRAGMESWFLRTCLYMDSSGRELPPDASVQKGDSYTFWWYGYTDEVQEQGEILEANGKDMFRFRFGKAGICTVRIKEAGSEQLVEMVQEEIPTDEKSRLLFHVGCKTGWTFYLTNLKSFFEGGPDLRNRHVDLQDMINS